jgi:uncharacterized protein YndB with AHSA1/START domain
MSRPLERRLVVSCPVAAAFAIFTARVDEWWPRSHRKLQDATLCFELKAGGRFFEKTAGGDEADLGAVVRWEPPHRLTYRWYPGVVSGATEVDVRFSEVEGGTLVEITHSEGDSALGTEWPVRVQRFDGAWSQVLPAYAEFVTRNEP